MATSCVFWGACYEFLWILRCKNIAVIFCNHIRLVFSCHHIRSRSWRPWPWFSAKSVFWLLWLSIFLCNPLQSGWSWSWCQPSDRFIFQLSFYSISLCNLLSFGLCWLWPSTKSVFLLPCLLFFSNACGSSCIGFHVIFCPCQPISFLLATICNLTTAFI